MLAIGFGQSLDRMNNIQLASFEYELLNDTKRKEKKKKTLVEESSGSRKAGRSRVLLSIDRGICLEMVSNFHLKFMIALVTKS